ncbi:YbaK/EbsC family protein [Candidatus Enterococcus courvalinii]|uniref:Prolyl-tRNA editing protein n=1 Tax=Candidatus Enterococcus courvalinii TaxID=2815329 RepID=A0ABS3HY26_9ENTE|nr:YbaK/EbsC family protein [Enterococcus sp. MSG2901]MBO0481326.1 prolyl-tRNA editing protein [Enterococcus sp. MSG2901]
MINLEEVFSQAGIDFELYDHRAIYTNEDALVVKAEQGFTGTETKSLYLKDKQKNNYIFLTFTTKKSDFKRLSKLIGKRVSVVSAEMMEEQTGQKPGAVSPFGYEAHVPVIIDEELLAHEKLVFAPGRPDQTMVVKVADLDKIIEVLNLETYLLPVEE